MSEIVLKLGDAIKELQKIESNSIDLVITDPPYNLNKDYTVSKDKLEFDDYLCFSTKWLTECQRVLKDTGTIYVFMGMRYISYVFAILEKELQMRFSNWITWHYTQGIGKTKGFSPRHDDILVFTKSNKFTFNLDDIRIPQKYYRSVNNMKGANPGNVWGFSHVHYCNKNRQKHPTQKPEGLYERIVLASSNENDVVLDPFIGSGTCARVCQQLNRSCIGIDNNKDYIDMCKKRLSESFYGFDSIDERMLRLPNDLNDIEVRKLYMKYHAEHFLKNHPKEQKAFLNDYEKDGNLLPLFIEK